MCVFAWTRKCNEKKNVMHRSTAPKRRTEAPHRSAAPQRLITTTIMADYCLCLCFLQLTRLVVECVLQQQFDLSIDSHKCFWFPCPSHFRRLLVFGFFYCLFVNSAQALCACSISSSLFLMNLKCHLEAWNVNYSILSRFNGSVFMQMLLKRCQGRRRKKTLFWYVWTRPKTV